MALPPRGLAAVEATSRPAYQRATRRAGGVSWNYPGFGRDPEVNPVAGPITQQTPVPVAAPTRAPVAEAATKRDEQRDNSALDATGGNGAGTGAGDAPSASTPSPDQSLTGIANSMREGFSALNPFSSIPALALADYLGLPPTLNLATALAGLMGSPTATSISVDRAEALEQTPTAVTDALMGFAPTAVAAPTAVEQEALTDLTSIPAPPPAAPPAPAATSTPATVDMTEAGLGNAPPGTGATVSTEGLESFGGDDKAGSADGGSKGEGPGGSMGDKGDAGYGSAEGDGGVAGDKGESGADGGGKGDDGGGTGASGADGSAGSHGGDSDGGGEGWAVGGYTGAGPDGVVQPNQPAGTVHEGELVIPAAAVPQAIPALAGITAGGNPMQRGAMLPQPGMGAPAAQMGGMGDSRTVQPFIPVADAMAAAPPPFQPPAPDGRTVTPFQVPSVAAHALDGGAPVAPGYDPMMSGAAMGEGIPGAGMGDGSAYDMEGTDDFGGYGDEAMGGDEGMSMLDDDGDDDFGQAGASVDAGYMGHDEHPYAEERDARDLFKPLDPERSSNGDAALSRMGALPQEAQQMAMQIMGSDPMMASVLLQILGPSYRPLIAQSLKASGAAAQMQQQAAMGGGMPPGGALGAVR